MSFRDEVKAHFMDEDGLVTVDRDPKGKWSTGNGLFNLGLFYTALHMMRQAEIPDVINFIATVHNCWHDKNQPGLLDRNPGRPDREAADDYDGVCATSFHFNTHQAKAVLEYGRRNWWFYNNENPGKKEFWSLHARFPGRVAFYKACVPSERTNVFDNLGLAAAITANALSPRDAVDAKLRTWLWITVVEGRCALVDDSIRLWKARAKRDYGNLGRLCAPSFGELHPFARLQIEF
jgi:hypothetical protein